MAAIHGAYIKEAPPGNFLGGIFLADKLWNFFSRTVIGLLGL